MSKAFNKCLKQIEQLSPEVVGDLHLILTNPKKYREKRLAEEHRTESELKAIQELQSLIKK